MRARCTPSPSTCSRARLCPRHPFHSFVSPCSRPPGEGNPAPASFHHHPFCGCARRLIRQHGGRARQLQWRPSRTIKGRCKHISMHRFGSIAHVIGISTGLTTRCSPNPTIAFTNP
ncbi:hypothetical protein FKM82_000652 [Ascaphus truei]